MNDKIKVDEIKVDEITALDKLGFSEIQVEIIKKIIRNPIGCTIISGTSSSGRSSSLRSFMNEIISENMNDEQSSCKIKLAYVNDIHESNIEHVRQYSVDRVKKEWSNDPFNYACRLALRDDPDTFIFSEVRSEDTAEFLSNTVQSGNKALAITHASSSIGTISRLRALGLSSDVLGLDSFISGLIHQALMPVNCNSCKLTFDTFISKIQSGEIELDKQDDLSHQQMLDGINLIATKDEIEKITFRNKNGCECCSQTGISGRTVVAEVIIPDQFMKSCFANEKENDAIDYYIENGGKLILDHAIDKMLSGILDPRDVERKLGRLKKG